MLLGDCNWAHGTECVWAFANIELLVITLALSSRNIVDDGVSPDMIQSVFLGYTKSSLANNDADFALIVNGFSELSMWENVFTMSNDAGGSLCENDWVCRLIYFIRGVVSSKLVWFVK